MEKPARIFAPILACCITTLPLSACTPADNEDHYAIALGSNTDFAGLELRSIFIVTAGENKPGRILGTVFNTTQEPVNLIISDADDAIPVSIPAGGKVEFRDSRLVLSSTEASSGARTDLTIQAKSKKTAFDVAVLDGTLEQYAPYVPD